MVYLVRQGQTDWNLQKKFNGITQTDLNATGIEQALRQAENLRDVHFDACYCSPQRRARHTCSLIYRGPIAFDDRLTEIDCGAFEGTQETPESFRQFWQAVRTGSQGTERFQDFLKRNCDFCDDIARDHRGKNVLIVTHAANARIINYYFTGKPADYDFGKAVGESGGLVTYENA